MDRTAQRHLRLGLVLLAGASLAACATVQPKYATRGGAGARPDGRSSIGQGGTRIGAPYQVGGIWYVPREQPNYDQTGTASWYGDAFNMKATANGETFDMNAVSAAHTTLPLPSMVEVTNLDNGRKLKVRINDRGPFVGDRIIDLSHEAARELGYDRKGLAHVRVRYLGPAPLLGPGAGVRYAQGKPASTLAPAAAAAPPQPASLAETFEVAGLPPPAQPVAAHDLPPLVGEALPPLGPAAAAKATPGQTLAAAAAALRIQAGAFSDEQNAQRAVSQLASAGTATIEPIQRNGTTLYRVVLPAPADEAEAFALRDRVAGIGFTDARVVRPF
jgi:rare lipoprotein A